jgi:hypothetical protein
MPMHGRRGNPVTKRDFGLPDGETRTRTGDTSTRNSHNDRPARVQAGMRTHTTSIEIQAPPSDTFAFVADGEKLPLWAIGFAKAIEPDGDQWIVTLASRERLPLRIDSEPATGVVDYVMLPAPGPRPPASRRRRTRA